ncbi:MAG: tetratricopeptide repeat protein [Bacteroidota bacterium]
MNKFAALLWLVVGFLPSTLLQATDIQQKARELTYQGFLQGRIEPYKEALNLLERAYQVNPEDETVAVEWIKTWHNMSGLLMDPAQNPDEGEKQVEACVEQAEKFVKKFPDTAELHALYGSLLGMEIGISPWKGMVLGGKSQKHLKKALELDNSSPLAWLFHADNKYHTPEMWGGDLKVAIEGYQKAIELMEADEEKLKYNCQYLSAHAWLGLAYHKTGNSAKALNTFEKSLEFEPDFAWVKYGLMPKVK